MRAYNRVAPLVVHPEDVPPDSGCRFSPRCLDCPLPMCKEELGPRRRLTGYEERNREIVAARRQGASWPELMARFKMSKATLRTVCRRNHGGV